MKNIFFATKNRGKVASIRSALSEYKIKVVQVPLDFPEPRTEDLKKIAKEKVLFAYDQIRKPCIALDSGFYIYSLNGFPKTYVSFALETIRIDGILRLVDGRMRECESRNCLTYMDKTLAEPKSFESTVEGRLSETPRGIMKDYFWSELFMIFIPKGENKTLAEMSTHKYRKWRKQRYKNSYTTKFAGWISKNKDD
jgi:XTP/dITP diphosphohydrolase